MKSRSTDLFVDRYNEAISRFIAVNSDVDAQLRAVLLAGGESAAKASSQNISVLLAEVLNSARLVDSIPDAQGLVCSDDLAFALCSVQARLATLHSLKNLQPVVGGPAEEADAVGVSPLALSAQAIESLRLRVIAEKALPLPLMLLVDICALLQHNILPQLHHKWDASGAGVDPARFASTVADPVQPSFLPCFPERVVRELLLPLWKCLEGAGLVWWPSTRFAGVSSPRQSLMEWIEEQYRPVDKTSSASEWLLRSELQQVAIRQFLQDYPAQSVLSWAGVGGGPMSPYSTSLFAGSESEPPGSLLSLQHHVQVSFGEKAGFEIGKVSLPLLAYSQLLLLFAQAAAAVRYYPLLQAIQVAVTNAFVAVSRNGGSWFAPEWVATGTSFAEADTAYLNLYGAHVASVLCYGTQQCEKQCTLYHAFEARRGAGSVDAAPAWLHDAEAQWGRVLGTLVATSRTLGTAQAPLVLAVHDARCYARSVASNRCLQPLRGGWGAIHGDTLETEDVVLGMSTFSKYEQTMLSLGTRLCEALPLRPATTASDGTQFASPPLAEHHAEIVARVTEYFASYANVLQAVYAEAVAREDERAGPEGGFPDMLAVDAVVSSAVDILTSDGARCVLSACAVTAPKTHPASNAEDDATDEASGAVESGLSSDGETAAALGDDEHVTRSVGGEGDAAPLCVTDGADAQEAAIAASRRNEEGARDVCLRLMREFLATTARATHGHSSGGGNAEGLVLPVYAISSCLDLLAVIAMLPATGDDVVLCRDLLTELIADHLLAQHVTPCEVYSVALRALLLAGDWDLIEKVLLHLEGNLTGEGSCRSRRESPGITATTVTADVFHSLLVAARDEGHPSVALLLRARRENLFF